MMRLYIHLAVLTWTVICFLDPGNVHARSGSNIDVALVMDSSGSMKKTDPKSLRIPAAKLFISLLDSNDRAAVLSFSDRGYTIANLTPVNNEAQKQKLLLAADKITSTGLYTNLYEAFHKGMEVLVDEKEEGREQIIVLMSDGMMDVGDHESDRQLLEKLTSELSGALKEQNIKVYAIAFTAQSDRRLLETLSKQTGGFYNLALTDKDFHLIFTSIFESLKSPDMLPMKQNGFLIDTTIQEVTIVVSKESAATEIQINAPDGQTYTGNQRYSGISWFISENFDMITVHKPVEGRWEILYSTGKNNKAYIITDLKLETNFEQLYAVFGENLDIQAWLEKEGDIIRVGEVLETTDIYIELNNPDGNTSNLKPLNSGDGIFQKRITPFKDGNYELRVIAKGKTYEREKTFVFKVANLQESKEDLKAAREARKNEQTEAQDNLTEEKQDPVNWTRIIIHLISINLIIGILVIAYMKRKSIKDLKLIGTFFKRFKYIRTFQAKKQETAAGDHEAGSATEKSSEQEAGKTAQITKTLIKLEDAEAEDTEAEQVNEEEKKEPAKEGIAIEETASTQDGSDDTSTDGALNTLEEEIQRLEKLKQQEDGIQTRETGKDTASETEEPTLSIESDEGQATINTDAQEAMQQEENVEEEQESNVEEQKTEEEPAQPEEVQESLVPQPDVKAAVDADEEETTQIEAQGEEESVDDMWADAMNEQAAESTEEKPESNVEEQKTKKQAPQPVEGIESPAPQSVVTAEVETDTEETAQTEAQGEEESVDDMWADAMNEQVLEGESVEEKTENAAETHITEDLVPLPEIKEMQEPASEAKKQVNAEINEETKQSEKEKAERVVEEHELHEDTHSAKANEAAETKTEEHEANVLRPEETKPDPDESNKGDIDAMWTAALDEQAEAESGEEKLSERKTDQEGPSGASS